MGGGFGGARARVSRRRFLGGAAALGGLALAGCGTAVGDPAAVGRRAALGGEGYVGPPVALDFWNGFTGGDGPVMQEMVDRFNAEHENIQVGVSQAEWSDYYQKISAAVASGEAPDVAIMHADQLATGAARRVIVPLDPVADSLGLQRTDFSPSVWEAGIYGGRRYGIPLDIHPLVFYYNKAVMEQGGLDPESPPQTRDEYMAALERLRSRGIQGHWMTSYLFTAYHQFASLTWQFGGGLYGGDPTRATVASEAGVEALSWMVDLVREEYSPRNVGQDADYVAFQGDQTAFHWNGIWMLIPLGEVPDLEWGIARLPQIGPEKAAWANSHNFVIPNQSRPDPNRLRAAAAFVGWISARSLDWATTGQIPARDSVRGERGFDDLQQADVARETLPTVHYSPPNPGVREINENVLFTAVNEAVLLLKEPEAALEDANRRADELLKLNESKYGEA